MNLNPAGGKVCVDAIDCFVWGNYTGSWVTRRGSTLDAFGATNLSSVDLIAKKGDTVRSQIIVCATFLAVGMASTTLVSCGGDCTEEATCAGESASPNDAGDGGASVDSIAPADAAAPAITMTATAPPTLLVGTSADIEVTVVRAGPDGVSGAIAVALEAQPGLSAPSIVIAEGSSTGKLSVTADVAKKHGKVDLVLEATAPSDRKGTATTSTILRGEPGSLDTSFGVDGTIASSTADSEATGIAIQSDGKVVVGGRAGTELTVLRLLENGDVDTSFNKGATTIAVPGGVFAAQDIVVDKSDALTLVFEDPYNDGSVLRLKADGSLDTSFGQAANGLVKLAIKTPTSMVVSSDGSLFIGGQGPQALKGEYILKLKTSGALDTTWANAGVFAENVANCGPATAICWTKAISLEPGGTLLACRPKDDGVTIDRLGVTGVKENILYSTSLVFNTCKALITDPAAAGFVFVGGDSNDTMTAGALHFQSGGSPTVFGAPAASGLTYARRLATVGSKLVIGAEAMVGGNAAFGVARLTPLHVIDTTFNKTGYLTLTIGGKPSTLKAMAIDALDRIVVAGTNGSLIAARIWQ